MLPALGPRSPPSHPGEPVCRSAAAVPWRCPLYAPLDPFIDLFSILRTNSNNALLSSQIIEMNTKFAATN